MVCLWDWLSAHGGLAVWVPAVFTVVNAIIAFAGVVWTARKGRQAAESLENLKTNLAFDLGRKTKFSEKEFEALSACWGYFIKLDRSITNLGSLFTELKCFLEEKKTLEGLDEYELNLYLDKELTLSDSAKRNIKHCYTGECDKIYLDLLADAYCDSLRKVTSQAGDEVSAAYIFLPLHVKQAFADAHNCMVEVASRLIVKADKRDNINFRIIDRIMKKYEEKISNIRDKLQKEITGELYTGYNKTKKIP